MRHERFLQTPGGSSFRASYLSRNEKAFVTSAVLLVQLRTLCFRPKHEKAGGRNKHDTEKQVKARSDPEPQRYKTHQSGRYNSKKRPMPPANPIPVALIDVGKSSVAYAPNGPEQPSTKKPTTGPIQKRTTGSVIQP